MATPSPAKKQKVSRPPIIFKAPGLLSPDVRFQIFGDHEFHVHSVVLNMNSAFFQRFLDPANMTPPGENSSLIVYEQRGVSSLPPVRSGFQYEWVSEIDDNGMYWHLASAAEVKKVDTADKTSASHDNEILEIQAFTNFLRAFYRQPLIIDEALDVVSLTRLADFLCELRSVPYEIEADLLKCGYFSDRYTLAVDAYELLDSVAKLRIAPLFNDLVIYCAGKWSDPANKNEYNGGKHEKIIERVHDRLGAEVAKALWGIEEALAKNYEGHSYRKSSGPALRRSRMERYKQRTKNELRNQHEASSIAMPLYFRKLSESLYGRLHVDPHDSRYAQQQELAFGIYVAPLLKSNLLLTNDAVPGEEDFEEYFLCCEFRDEDYPWDLNDTESDW